MTTTPPAPGQQLSDRQRAILRLIDTGRDRMDYMIDAIAVDNASLRRDIEHLERERFIARKGGALGSFYSFILLTRGQAALSPASEGELALKGDRLTTDDLRVLRSMEGKPAVLIEDVAAATGLPEPELLATVNFHINVTGYVREFGFFRRKLALTPTGAAVLAKHAASALTRG